MAIALEYNVHVALGGPKAVLHTKAALLQKLLRALSTQLKLRHTDDDRASNFKQLFRYRTTSAQAASLGRGSTVYADDQPGYMALALKNTLGYHFCPSISCGPHVLF
jgi:hypothetical protein